VTRLDALALDAALWRASRHLAAPWLHALRGYLNVLSLNLVLLRETTPDREGDPPANAMRRQLRELETALTRLFDSATDDAAGGRCDVVSIVTDIRDLVDPLAKRRRVSVELSASVRSPIADIEGHVLRSVLFPAVVDLLLHAPACSPVTLVVADDPGGALRIDVGSGDGAPWPEADEAFRDAATRAIQSLGGSVQWTLRAPGLSLFLRPSRAAMA
jgi:hypothetical protein